jgi:hypothetical protein
MSAKSIQLTEVLIEASNKDKVDFMGDNNY